MIKLQFPNKFQKKYLELEFIQLQYSIPKHWSSGPYDDGGDQKIIIYSDLRNTTRANQMDIENAVSDITVI